MTTCTSGPSWPASRRGRRCTGSPNDELCAAGRAVGFATFYSMLDLVPAASPWVKQSGVRRWMLGSVRRSPWLRALALTQAGGSIFMVKRPRAEAVGSD